MPFLIRVICICESVNVMKVLYGIHHIYAFYCVCFSMGHKTYTAPDNGVFSVFCFFFNKKKY